MSEVEPLFIVRMPDGRKSKPATKERIREMHLTGKVSDEAIVTRVGTVYDIPIRVFLGMSSPKVAETPEVSRQIASDDDAGASVDPPPLRPKSFRYQSSEGIADSALSWFGAVLYWPIQGFLIPTKGADKTRDYLRRTIGWIEIWLRLMHLASVILVLIMALVTVRMLALEFQAIRQNGTDDLIYAVLRIAAGIYSYLFAFLWLMLIQAILRLVPAALRYWIETTEERRTVGGKAQ
jgi:hypothetical protein